MHKRVAFAIFICISLGLTAFAQRKKPGRGVAIGSKIEQPSNAEIAGKLDDVDEYKVYSSIISSTFGDAKGRSVVVRRMSRNTTVRDFSDKYTRLAVKADFPKLDLRTLDDFVSKNGKSYELSAQDFDADSKIFLIADLDNVIAGAATCEAGWRKFYRLYPAAKGYIIFTRAGFNLEKTQAFVYADYWSSCKNGGGQFYFLQKEGGIWKVTSTQIRWTNNISM